jgi:acyl-CoA thioester hydrolase
MNDRSHRSHPTAHTVTVRVRYAETDQMGVVHHANYLVWFELARSAYCRRQGVPYARIEEELGLRLPVVEASIRYKAPARYDEEVDIEAYILQRTRRTIRFGYAVRRGDRELARGETTHMLVDADGRPRAWPEEVAAALDAPPAPESPAS